MRTPAIGFDPAAGSLRVRLVSRLRDQPGVSQSWITLDQHLAWHDRTRPDDLNRAQFVALVRDALTPKRC